MNRVNTVNIVNAVNAINTVNTVRGAYLDNSTIHFVYIGGLIWITALSILFRNEFHCSCSFGSGYDLPHIKVSSSSKILINKQQETDKEKKRKQRFLMGFES